VLDLLEGVAAVAFSGNVRLARSLPDDPHDLRYIVYRVAQLLPAARKMETVTVIECSRQVSAEQAWMDVIGDNASRVQLVPDINAVTAQARGQRVVIRCEHPHGLFVQKERLVLAPMRVPVLLCPSGASLADLGRITYLSPTEIEVDAHDALKNLRALCHRVGISSDVLRAAVTDRLPEGATLETLRAAGPLLALLEPRHHRCVARCCADSDSSERCDQLTLSTQPLQVPSDEDVVLELPSQRVEICVKAGQYDLHTLGVTLRSELQKYDVKVTEHNGLIFESSQRFGLDLTRAPNAARGAGHGACALRGCAIYAPIVSGAHPYVHPALRFWHDGSLWAHAELTSPVAATKRGNKLILKRPALLHPGQAVMLGIDQRYEIAIVEGHESGDTLTLKHSASTQGDCVLHELCWLPSVRAKINNVWYDVPLNSAVQISPQTANLRR
jgi:hypothetical protein